MCKYTQNAAALTEPRHRARPLRAAGSEARAGADEFPQRFVARHVVVGPGPHIARGRRQFGRTPPKPADASAPHAFLIFQPAFIISAV